MRNRNIILVLWFTLISGYLQAQVVNGIGIKSGVSVSSISGKSTFPSVTGKTDILTGLYESFFAELLAHKNFRIVSNLGYIQKGGTKDDYTIGGKKIYRISYITFNALFEGKLNLAKLHPYILAGPRVDLLISVNKDEIYGILYPQKINYGLAYGAGIDYSFDKYSLKLELLKNFNFNKIYNRPYCDECVPGIFNDNTFSVAVGIKYHLVKNAVNEN